MWPRAWAAAGPGQQSWRLAHAQGCGPRGGGKAGGPQAGAELSEPKERGGLLPCPCPRSRPDWSLSLSQQGLRCCASPRPAPSRQNSAPPVHRTEAARVSLSPEARQTATGSGQGPACLQPTPHVHGPRRGAGGDTVSSFPPAGGGGHTACLGCPAYPPFPRFSPKPSPFSRKSQKCPYLEHQPGLGWGWGAC